MAGCDLETPETTGPKPPWFQGFWQVINAEKELTLKVAVWRREKRGPASHIQDLVVQGRNATTVDM